MKNNYIERAKHFIEALYPYLPEKQECSLYCYEQAISTFNLDKKRKVQIESGSTRVCFITSDYVVKIDYCENSYWGNSAQEYEAWNEYFKESDYADCFAPIHYFCFKGKEFYIMPRIAAVGSNKAWDLLCEDWDFYDWICDCVRDIHEGNFGIKNGHAICIDYASARY